MAPYMLQAQQKWAITPVANAGGYPGAPYFKITIAGTDRALAATADTELVVLPAFTGAPEQLWRLDQLADGTYRIMPRAVPNSRDTARAVGGRQQRADSCDVQTRQRPSALGVEDAVMVRTSIVLIGSALLFGAAPQQAPPAPAPARGPAPSLVRPLTPTKAPDAAGFLQRWLVLEPIRVAGQLTDGAVQALVKKEYFPTQFTVIPHDGDRVTVGDVSLSWHAVDTINYNVNLYHFAYALNKPTSNVLFWAVTSVEASSDMPGVRLAIGSNAASVWWLNGQEVIGLYNDRQAVIDDGVSKRLTLKKGPNVIRAAIVNAGGATDFCARFLDGEDNPIKGSSCAWPAGGKDAVDTGPRSR